MDNKALSLVDALARVETSLQNKGALPTTPVYAPSNDYSAYGDYQGYLDQNRGMDNPDAYRYFSQQSADENREGVERFQNLQEETGLTSFSNLTSNNPFIWTAANAANWGKMAAGQFVNMGLNTVANDIQADAVALRADPNRDDGGFFGNSPGEFLERVLFGHTPVELQNKMTKMKFGLSDKDPEQVKQLADGLSAKAVAIGGNEATGAPNLLNTDSWGNHFARDSFQRSKGDLDEQVNTLQDQATAAYENGDYGSAFGLMAKAVGKGVGGNAGAIWDNPRFLGDTFAETLPFLLGRGIGVSAIAMDQQRVENQSVLKFQEREGRDPTESEMNQMKAAATAYTGLNFLERATLLGAAKGTLPSLENALGRGVASTAGTGSKLAAVASGVAAPVGHITKAGVMEGITEAAQTQIENDWGNLSGDVNLASVVEAGTLGAAMGGTLAVPGSVVQTGQKIKDKVVGNMQQQAINRMQEQVGDLQVPTEEMVDPSSKQYAPAKATNRIILSALNSKDPEELEAAASQVNDIHNTVNEQFNFFDSVVTAAATPESIQAAEDYYAQKVENAAAKKAQFAGTPQEAQVNEIIDNLLLQETSKIEAIRELAANPEKLQDFTKERDRYSKFSTEIQNGRKRFDEYLTSQQASTTNNEQAQPGVKTKSSYPDFLSAPHDYSEDDVRQLLASTELSESEKQNIRLVSDAIVAQNALKTDEKVNSEVLNGGKNYRGLTQYMSQMGIAVANQDVGTQNVLIRQMDNFLTSHQNKLAAVEQAQEKANQTGKAVQVTRGNDLSWNVQDGKYLPRKVFKQNQGVVVYPSDKNGKDSAKLIKRISSEVQAITATRTAMNGLFQSRPADSFESRLDNAINSAIQPVDVQTPTNVPVNAQNVPDAQPGQTSPTPELGMASPKTITDDPMDFSADEILDNADQQQRAALRQQNEDFLNQQTVQDPQELINSSELVHTSPDGKTRIVVPMSNEIQNDSLLVDRGDGVITSVPVSELSLPVSNEPSKPEVTNDISQNTTENTAAPNADLNVEAAYDLLNKAILKEDLNQVVQIIEQLQEVVPYASFVEHMQKLLIAAPNAFDLAMDSLNADERENGRDTSARDSDPKVRKVNKPVTASNDTTVETLKGDNVRITKKIDNNTSLVTINGKEGNRKLFEYRTKYPAALSEEDSEGNMILLDVEIYRDPNNPEVISRVRIRNPNDPRETLNLSKQGTQTDEQFIKGFATATDTTVNPDTRYSGKLNRIQKPEKQAKPDVTVENMKGDKRRITKKIDDNTSLVTVTDKDGNEILSEYRTKYPSALIEQDEQGNTTNWDVEIYRDPANPEVITKVNVRNSDDASDVHAMGKQGTQTDEQFINSYTDISYTTVNPNTKTTTNLPKVDKADQTAAIDPVVTEDADTNSDTNLDTDEDIYEESEPEIVLPDNHETPTGKAAPGAISPIGEDVKATVEAERAKEFRQQNLITSGFTQRAKDGFNSPLVLAKNFAQENLKPENFEAIVREYTGREMNDYQRQALYQFMKYEVKIRRATHNLIKVPTPKDMEYRYHKYTQYLLNEDGQIDENVATAIAAVTYAWISEMGSNIYSNADEVGQKFGMSGVTVVPPNIFTEMSAVGTHQPTLMADLGQRVYQALQFKILNGVDPKRAGKLQMALGATAVMAMVKAGYVQVTTKSGRDMMEMSLALQELNPESTSARLTGQNNDWASTTFIRPKVAINENLLEPSSVITDITRAARNSNGIVSKIFSFSPYIGMPSATPVTEVPATFNEQGSVVPKLAKEVMLQKQAEPYEFNESLWSTVGKLYASSPETLYRLFGWKSAEELAKMHIVAATSQQAVNESVIRSLQLVSTVRDGLNGSNEFYLPMTMHRQNRSGYASAFNLQENKVHRAVASLVSDRMDVPVTDNPFNENGTLNAYGEFLRAISFRMEDAPINFQGSLPPGTKIDSSEYQTFIPHLLEYLDSSPVRAAIDAMVRIKQDDTATEEDLKTIEDMVNGQWKMSGLSLAVLDTLANRQIAMTNGETTFLSQIPSGSDGVSNGAVFTGIQMDTLDAVDRMNGGVFPKAAKGDLQFTSVPQYRQRSNSALAKDAYEKVARAKQGTWTKSKREMSSYKASIANALDMLNPNFTKRKGAKDEVIPVNYGSTVRSAIQSAGIAALDSAYDLLNKATVNDDMAQVNRIIGQLQKVISYGSFVEHIKKYGSKDGHKAPILDKPADLNAARKFLLDSRQQQSFLTGFKSLQGKVIEEALNTIYAESFDQRNRKNSLANNGYTVYTMLRNKMIEAATRKANIPFLRGTQAEALDNESIAKIDKELRRFLPALVTAFGVHSKQHNSTAIPLFKSETGWDISPVSQQELDFTGVFFELTDESSPEYKQQHEKRKNGNINITTNLRERITAAPGVSGMALYIQSLDAYVTFRTMEKHGVQNFHDNNEGNALLINAIARTQNEAFLDAMTISHMGKSFVGAFLKPYQGLVSLDNLLSQDEKVSIAKDLAGVLHDHYFSPNLNYEAMFKAIVNSHYQRDLKKMYRIVTEEFFNQYGTQGGEYQMTDAKRAAIIKRTDALKKDKERALKKAEEIGQHLDKNYPSMQDVNAEEQAQEYLDGEVKDTHNELVTRGKWNAKALTNMLRLQLAKHQNAQGTAGQFSQGYSIMLDMVDQFIAKDIEINVFNEGNVPKDIRGYDPKENSPAWYTEPENGKPAQINFIYGQNLRNKSTEVVVHELVHGITSSILNAYYSNPDAHPDLKEPVQDLERILGEVRKQVTDQHDPMIQNAVKDVHEFIATGLTNPKVIRFLMDIPVKAPANGMARLTDGFREIVTSLVKIFSKFAGKRAAVNTKQVSAYAAMLMNTAALLQNGQGANATESPKPTSNYPGQKQNAQNTVRQYTAKQVFDSLSDNQISPEFKQHLGRMMDSLTDKLFEALPRKYIQSAKQLSMPDLWDEAIKTGKAPYSSAALTAGFKLTMQEQFAVEALEVTMNMAIQDKSLTKLFKEMQGIYDQAAEVLSVESFHDGDWNTATRSEKQIAQQKRNYLFNDSYKANSLSRFTALALGHESTNKLLAYYMGNTQVTGKKTWFEKLVSLADRIIDSAFGIVTGTLGVGKANTKLELLAQHLVDIEIKNRDRATNIVEKAMGTVEDVMDESTQKLRDGLTQLLDTSPSANSSNKYVGLAHDTARAAINGRSMKILDTIKEYRDQGYSGERLGVRGELLNEIKEGSPSRDMAQKILRYTKKNENDAQTVRTSTKQVILSLFENNGKDLTPEARAAITNAGLRTDMQSLVGDYSHQQILELLANDQKLQGEISRLTSMVSPEVSVMAKTLGYYMLAGKGNNHLAKNAQLIALAGATTGSGSVDPALIPVIDKLATMHAMAYLKPSDKKSFVDTMGKELARGNENGFIELLNFHKQLIQDSASTIFQSNPLSMSKGWTPDIVNPHRDVVIAHTQAELDNYRNAFYKDIAKLGSDAIDPAQREAIMLYAEDSGNQRIVSGAIALRTLARKGSQIAMDGTQLAKAKAKIASDLKRKAADPDYDPRKDSSMAIPSYDSEGNVIAYNYEMSGHVRDTYLERNNDFSDLVAEYAATGLGKVLDANQNLVNVDALFEDYQQNYASSPNSYIRVAADSQDPAVQRAWAMMPREVRQYAKEKWGSNAMYVHNEAFLPVFGFRKLSMSNAFKDDVDRTAFGEAKDAVVRAVLGTLFGDSAAMKSAQIERVWQEVVQKSKSFMVIRNITTLLGNMVANTFLLSAHGVPITSIIRDTIKSTKGALQYRRDRANLIRLQLLQSARPGKAAEIQKEIDKLQYSLEHNPMGDFINEGMLAGIVEDVDPSQDRYTYTSGLQRKFDVITDKVPELFKTAASYALVSPGTPHYKFLHSATQFSDFSAKYVLYKHAMTRKKDRMTHNEAIKLAEDNFINYDMHTSPELQYLNDMGMVMFTKYNLRIQRALFQLIAKRPASVLVQTMMLNSLSSLPPGIDPLVFNQLGNPLRNGAFGLLDTWDEPFPIQMFKALF